MEGLLLIFLAGSCLAGPEGASGAPSGWCRIPDFDDGVSHTCEEREVGETCWAYCKEGYEYGAEQYSCQPTADGPAFVPRGEPISCQAAKSESAAAAEKDQRSLRSAPVDRGRMLATTCSYTTAFGSWDNCDGISAGATCTVLCDLGYESSSSSSFAVLRCNNQATGFSTFLGDLPTCTASACDVSTLVADESEDASACGDGSLVTGDTAAVNCAAGYVGLGTTCECVAWGGILTGESSCTATTTTSTNTTTTVTTSTETATATTTATTITTTSTETTETTTVTATTNTTTSTATTATSTSTVTTATTSSTATTVTTTSTATTVTTTSSTATTVTVTTSSQTTTFTTTSATSTTTTTTSSTASTTTSSTTSTTTTTSSTTNTTTTTSTTTTTFTTSTITVTATTTTTTTTTTTSTRTYTTTETQTTVTTTTTTSTTTSSSTSSSTTSTTTTSTATTTSSTTNTTTTTSTTTTTFTTSTVTATATTTTTTTTTTTSTTTYTTTGTTLTETQTTVTTTTTTSTTTSSSTSSSTTSSSTTLSSTTLSSTTTSTTSSTASITGTATTGSATSITGATTTSTEIRASSTDFATTTTVTGTSVTTTSATTTDTTLLLLEDGLWRAEGDLTMEVANAQELMDAIEEDQDAVFEVLAIGIANSIEGVSPENVTVFDVQLVTRRLLDEIEEIVRRLAQGSIKVHYVIHLDNEEAAKAGVNADTVSAQLTTYGAAAIMAAFQDNNQGITFNFTLTVLSVAAEPPSQEVVQQPIVPTVTQTTTQTFSAVSPLDQSKGSASAASAGVVVAAFLMFIFVVVATCAVKFIFARKRKKQELPKFQSVEEGQVADLEPQHIIWHVDELRIASAASEPAASEPAPSIIADFEEELPTPILPDGSQVEYWSRTHSIWLPGVLHVVMVPGTLVSEPKVTYNIEVNTGGNKVQLRANVPIDGFRMPLARGEPVEVHSASAKKWLPAVVDGRQGSPTLQGYRLVLTPGAGDGIAGRVLEKVPAARVRRRFHQGALVSRYVGPVDGFETGFVDETGQAEPLGDNAFGPGLIGPSPSTVSLYSKISNLSMPAAPAGSTLAWDKNMENATGTPDQSNLGEICQWSWIKYSSCEDDSSVVVPSFCLSTLAQE